jgi:hypothetical protein
MTFQHIVLNLASAGVILLGTPFALAQSGTVATQEPATPLPNVQGRGVRIVPADAPPPAPVAPTPQPFKSEAPAAVSKPKPIAAPGNRPPLPAPVIKPCARPIATPTLRFSDPSRFDRALKPKLRGSRSVSVDIESPYPAKNEAPAPLGAWLNEIKQSGGQVTVSTYCEGGRGFGSFLARIFGGPPAEPYRAARRYDATLYVDAVDQIVTQVQFTPRKAAR